MARTGFKVTIYLDDNPSSSGYMQTYEERVEDTFTCPTSEDNWVLISSNCEIVMSGYTGYRLLTYYNTVSGEYRYVREEDEECDESSTEEQWVNSGSPYCETTEQGLNTGYMLQLQVQMNPNLPNYGETRYQRYKSPQCGGNNCPQWELVSKQCHITVANCVATFDGTADIVEIDVNPLSPSYNQTRTVNKEDSDCENCTTSLFSWELVGDMCGDDTLLCENGIQQVSTNSYTVSRKYKTIAGGTPIPMDEYQVVLKTEDDVNCGYIRPIYEMRKIVGQYLCDFETYTKYEKWCQYVSYDNGETWSYVVPEVCERGAVIAYESYDCGKPMYRWIPNGEFTCVDNGDDGKIMYWDSNSVMVSAYTCDEYDYIDASHVSSMTQVVSGITSPDGYKDTYQVGDCVSTINGLGLSGNEAKIWLGNYTNTINSGLQNYQRTSLDIPSRVSYIGNVFSNSTNYLRTMVMHPMTPPTLSGNTSMPIPMKNPQTYKNAGIFVPYDAYDDYLEDWSTYSSIIKPMDNDTDPHKAIIGYESDFTSWKCYVPDGESISTIGQQEWIYGGSNITSITLTNKIITVENNAFYNSDSYNLTELNLGESVRYIGNNAFKVASYCKVSTLVIPSSVRTIGNYAFYGYPLTSLTINNGVETIGNSVFTDHWLTAITVPDSVQTIGSDAFKTSHTRPYDAEGCQCKGSLITRIEIGSGCTSIGTNAFYGSATNHGWSLDTVIVKALTPPTIPNPHWSVSNIFSDNYIGTSDESKHYPYGHFTIYVPYESYDDYMRSRWQFFDGGSCSVVPYNTSGEKIATLYLDDGTSVEVEVLARKTLSDYANVTTAITVNDNCKTINNKAFVDFTKLESITMESSVPVPIGSLETKNFDILKIYVPSNAYTDYIDEWNEYEGRIIPIGAQEEYIKKYTFLDLYDSKKKDKYQLIITYDGQRIWKDIYRFDDIASDCYSVSYNIYGVVGGLGSELNTYEHVWNQINGTSLVSQMVYISNLELTNLDTFTVRMTFSNIPSSTLTLPFRVQLQNRYDNSGNPNGTIYFYSGDTEVTELRQSQAYQHPIEGDGWDRSYNVNIPTSDGVCGVYFNFRPIDKKSYHSEDSNGHTRWVTLSLDREIILESYN